MSIQICLKNNPQCYVKGDHCHVYIAFKFLARENSNLLCNERQYVKLCFALILMLAECAFWVHL